jgi:hypothetical protein
VVSVAPIFLRIETDHRRLRDLDIGVNYRSPDTAIAAYLGITQKDGGVDLAVTINPDAW